MNTAVTELTAIEPVTLRPDDNGGVLVVDIGNRRAIHLTDADVNRLIASHGETNHAGQGEDAALHGAP
jgi:hypothetical protein